MNYIGFFNKNKIFSRKTPLNLMNYQLMPRYQRLVFLRAPKHFNAGLHQLQNIKTTCKIILPVNKRSANIFTLKPLAIKLLNYQPLKSPITQTYHIKLKVEVPIKFLV